MRRKITSLWLSVLIMFSVCVFGTGSVSADISGLPEVEDGCNRYFFLMPRKWRNEYAHTVGIYWWEGTDAAASWPGYEAHITEIPSVYYYDVPKDVTTIIWNNYVDLSLEEYDERKWANEQTVNLSTEGYAPDENELYPEGIDSFDGMIFAVDPDKTSTSVLDGKISWEGDWYYYYGNAECGIYPEKTKGDYTISLNYLKSVFPDNNYAFYKEIAPCFYPERYNDDYVDRVNPWGNYDMLYAHFEDSFEEPEYVVFVGCVGPAAYAYTYEQFGDYVVVHHEIDSLYELSHYVYVPAEEKVYTLREAWENEEIDLIPAFESGMVGAPRGDADKDGTLTIKDATYIQKHLANIKGYKSTNYYMNCDDETAITIKDATTIQKKIAGVL